MYDPHTLPFNTQSLSPTLQVYLQAAQPEYVYHYTSADALLGIINNQEMWCTDYRFMNDVSELEHAFGLCLSLLDEQIKKTEESGDTGLLSFLVELKNRLTMPNHTSYFIGSFTELPDALSQWRAYCPPTGGYAVGFPTSFINDIVQTNEKYPAIPNEFVKCIYDLEDQTKIFKDIIASLCYYYVNVLDGGLYTASNERKFWMLLHASDFIVKCWSVMKHHSFKEENEWRLVIGRPFGQMGLPGNPQLGFRPSTKGITPFYKYRLERNEDYKACSVMRYCMSINEMLTIRIGPSLDILNRKIALNQMLLNAVFDNGSKRVTLMSKYIVETSSIPYRSW
jgi:hypothetical protein